jgi:DNA-binding MarR family transcriptional regulator
MQPMRHIRLIELRAACNHVIVACVIHASDSVQPDVFGAMLRSMRAFKRQISEGPVEGPCLGVLWELQTRGASRPSDLAAAVGLDASTVSRHLQTLERGGFVARTRDTEDGRARSVEVTPTGSALIADAGTARDALLSAAMSGWTPDDRLTLFNLLNRLADNLTESEAGTSKNGAQLRETVSLRESRSLVSTPAGPSPAARTSTSITTPSQETN